MLAAWQTQPPVGKLVNRLEATRYMIQKLAKLGRMLPDDAVDIDPFGIIEDYPDRPIIFMLFDGEPDNWTYAGCDSEEYQKRKRMKYLLIPKPGRQTSEFPTIDVFQAGDLIKDGLADFSTGKVGDKMLKILGKYGNTFDGIVELLLNDTRLQEDIAKEIGETSRFALSLKLNGKMPGESPFFKAKRDEISSQTVSPQYYQDGKKSFIAKDKLCVLTGEQSDVFGYSSFYNFYAPKTEISVVAGGFDKKHAWKNFPTSRSGVEQVERGKYFIEENLHFRFSGLDYFLVPEQVLDFDSDGFLDDLDELPKFSISDPDASKIEINIVDALGTQHNSATFTMFFFEKNNAEFKILSSIDDIAPSYARRLRDTIYEIQQDSIFHDLPGKNGMFSIEFRSFKALRTFFPKSKIEGDHTAKFLELVRAVLMQRPVSYSLLLHYIMMKIRRVHVEDGYLKMFALQAWLILLVFDKMQISTIPHDKTETIHMNVAKGKMRDIVTEFFSSHPKFDELNSSHRGIFLLGALAQKLLNMQQMERSAQPFRARLNGMHISQKVAIRMLPEMINKFKDYGKFYKSYQDLASIISEEFVSADDKMSDDERSFYFALGMSLEAHFRVGKEEEHEQADA